MTTRNARVDNGPSERERTTAADRESKRTAVLDGIRSRLAAMDPQVTGALHVDMSAAFIQVGGLVTSTVLTMGDLQSAVDGALMDNGVMGVSMVNAVIRPPAFTVDDEEGHSPEPPRPTDPDVEAHPDRVDALYYGWRPVADLIPTDGFKMYNYEFADKERRVIEQFGFIAPIVTDHTLRVIDGNLRLNIARQLGIDYVPVIMLDIPREGAKVLSLLLNRSSEFQRWNYDNVDPFVDSMPGAAEVLEPFGFFGQTVMPQTFLNKSILDYRVYEDGVSTLYSQDDELAKWAADMRRQLDHQTDVFTKKREEQLNTAGVGIYSEKRRTPAEVKAAIRAEAIATAELEAREEREYLAEGHTHDEWIEERRKRRLERNRRKKEENAARPTNWTGMVTVTGAPKTVRRKNEARPPVLSPEETVALAEENKRTGRKPKVAATVDDDVTIVTPELVAERNSAGVKAGDGKAYDPKLGREQLDGGLNEHVLSSEELARGDRSTPKGHSTVRYVADDRRRNGDGEE